MDEPNTIISPNSLISKRIRAIRKEHELNQTEMAERLGVHPSYVSLLERKKDQQPSAQFIKNLCSQFEINEEWLRTGNGPKKTQRSVEFKGENLDYNLNAEMIRNFPELRHLLLYAEENDRAGFNLQIKHFFQRLTKEEGDQDSKQQGVEQGEGTKKTQAA